MFNYINTYRHYQKIDNMEELIAVLYMSELIEKEFKYKIKTREIISSFHMKTQKNIPFTSKQAELLLSILSHISHDKFYLYYHDETAQQIINLIKKPVWKLPLDSHILKNPILDYEIVDGCYYLTLGRNYETEYVNEFKSIINFLNEECPGIRWGFYNPERRRNFILITPVSMTLFNAFLDKWGFEKDEKLNKYIQEISIDPELDDHFLIKIENNKVVNEAADPNLSLFENVVNLRKKGYNLNNKNLEILINNKEKLSHPCIKDISDTNARLIKKHIAKDFSTATVQSLLYYNIFMENYPIALGISSDRKDEIQELLNIPVLVKVDKDNKGSIYIGGNLAKFKSIYTSLIYEIGNSIFGKTHKQGQYKINAKDWR